MTVTILSSSTENASASMLNVSVKDIGWIILEPNFGTGYNDKTVIKNGDVLYLNFAAGLGDDEYKGCYGFQPNSTYRFEKLFKVTNIKDKTIYIWITVHGVFKEYDWIHVYSDNGWDKNSEVKEYQIALEKNESFYISVDFVDVPEGIELGEYSGEIIFHTKLANPEPTQNAEEEESEEPGNTSPNTGDYADMHTFFLLIFSLSTIILLKVKK